MKNTLSSSFQKLNENADRVKEIITVLAKYGLADWLEESKIEWLNKYLIKSKPKKYSTQKKEVRIRMALSELGTTFIKLGQLLSTKPDLVGENLAMELSKLQNQIKPDSINYIRSVIKDELKIKTIDEVFAEFSSRPLASASVAQVHAAELITGEKVVVKIIHKGIESQVEKDMEILEALAKLAEKQNNKIRQYQPEQTVRAFRKILLDELDLSKEMNNLLSFNKNFAENERVLFPKPYPEFTGKRLLTMQYIEGANISEVISPENNNNDLAQLGAQVYMDMIFRDNFFHADPHPGNFFIMPDRSLAIIDCGMVGRMDEAGKENIENLVVGIVEKDTAHIKDAIIEIGSVPADCNMDLFSTQIEDFINQHLNIPLSQVDLSTAIKQATEIIQSHNIILPSNISLLLRVLSMLEGSTRKLNPDFNLMVLFQDYYPKIVLKRFSPKMLLKKARKNVRQWEKAFELTPKVLLKLLSNADKSNFKISLEHKNLENSVNRLVTGLLATALFIGSSMIVSARITPLLGDYSFLGLAGILISFFVGVRLLISINKKGTEDDSSGTKY